MKDCCKDGCQHTAEKSVVKKWINYMLYTIIVVIVISALMIQLTSK